jgi:hypothetical protein
MTLIARPAGAHSLLEARGETDQLVLRHAIQAYGHDLGPTVRQRARLVETSVSTCSSRWASTLEQHTTNAPRPIATVMDIGRGPSAHGRYDEGTRRR